MVGKWNKSGIKWKGNERDREVNGNRIEEEELYSEVDIGNKL